MKRVGKGKVLHIEISAAPTHTEGEVKDKTYDVKRVGKGQVPHLDKAGAAADGTNELGRMKFNARDGLVAAL